MKGLLFDIQRGSLSNGPGIRTTIFLKGCPLDCIWCHNPESKSRKRQAKPVTGEPIAKMTARFRGKSGIPSLTVNQQFEIEGVGDKDLSCIKKEIIGNLMSVEEVMAIVLKDQHYYKAGQGGLTLSGGEPLMQADFALSALQAAKKAGVHTCLDTCGYVAHKQLLATLPFTDLYLFDYKTTSADTHRKFTGKSNDLIINNLIALAEAGANIRLRCPLIPSINITDVHLEGIINLVQCLPIQEVELLPYQRYWLGKYPGLVQGNPLADTENLAPDVLKKWQQSLAEEGIAVI